MDEPAEEGRQDKGRQGPVNHPSINQSLGLGDWMLGWSVLRNPAVGERPRRRGVLMPCSCTDTLVVVERLAGVRTRVRVL